ncbi:MAG: hypothetical protein LBC74_04335 [Planctomycetaceae bacterium]|nr:hypothetical protein [Planctomycetaceae bacterium]
MRTPLIHTKERNYSPPSEGLGMVSEELMAVFRCSSFVALMFFLVREKI